MNNNLHDNYQKIKTWLDSNKTLKLLSSLGLGLICLFALGKVFNVLASTVRGFNDFKFAINGK